MRETDEMQASRRELGNQLSIFRRAAGMTQRELASKAYCHRTQIAHLERGTARASEQLWKTIDDAVAAAGALHAAAIDIAKEKLRREQQEIERARSAAGSQAQRIRHVRSDGGWTPTTGAPDPVLGPGHSNVERSQKSWRQVRAYLSAHRTELTRQAADLYDRGQRVFDTPTLASPTWIPADPIPLDELTLTRADTSPPPLCTGKEPELRAIMPMRAPRRAYSRYTSALRYLDPPGLLENRPSYRLIAAELDDRRADMTFGLATYFDRLDVSEGLSHEFAAAAQRGDTSWNSLPFRSLFGDPYDLSTRPVCPGIITLTLRLHPENLAPSLLLFSRDTHSVAVGGGQLGLTPAGEFQPSSIHPDSVSADLDIWRNIVREYSEEVLGEPEHDGSSGVTLDYENWSFYQAMQKARSTERIRVYFLGIVLHALSLNAAILTVAIFEHDIFDTLFRDYTPSSAEGRLIGPRVGRNFIPAIPFDQRNVSELLANSPLGGTARACITLAWNKRAAYLS